MVQILLGKIYMLDSINLQMTLVQSKYGFRKISFIIKMVDYYTTHTDFQTTHVRGPRARFAGCSFQTHIRLSGFTVQLLSMFGMITFPAFLRLGDNLIT